MLLGDLKDLEIERLKRENAAKDVLIAEQAKEIAGLKRQYGIQE